MSQSASSADEPQPFVIDEANDAAARDAGAAPRTIGYRGDGRNISTERIRDLSKERRALLRIRSWCVVAAASFGVAVIQLTLLIVHHLRTTGWHWKPAVYALLLPAAGFGLVRFARRAASISHELRKPVLDEPTAPPDFSTLSDGSQQCKNLEEM